MALPSRLLLPGNTWPTPQVHQWSRLLGLQEAMHHTSPPTCRLCPPLLKRTRATDTSPPPRQQWVRTIDMATSPLSNAPLRNSWREFSGLIGL